MQKPNAKNQNTIVIIAGPSLTGKSNLASLLAEQGFVQLISSTTRAPREGEIDGVHYHFLSKDEFRRQLSQKKFLEHVEVDARMEEIDGKLVKSEGNFYGMGLDDAHRAFGTGRPVVAVCEPTGVKAIYQRSMEEGWSPVRVFLNNKQELLVQRFLERFKNDAKAKPEAYAARLIKMVDFERKNWVEPARDGTDPYEIVFPTFEAANEIEVLHDVLKRVGVGYKPKRSPSP